jgi:hypothetical protein
MSAINVNSITGRTGTHGPVLTGVTTATNGLNVTGGSVGIGTDDPGVQLEVKGTASTLLRLDSSSSSGTSLRILNGGTDKMYMGLAGDFITGQGSNVTDSAVRANGALLFSTGGGTERLRITSAGLVGIGTSTPSTKLHVNSADASATYLRVENTAGQAYFGVDTSGNSYAGAETNDAFGLVTNGSYRMYITSGGSVGIGITSPGESLSLIEGTALGWNDTSGNNAARIYATSGDELRFDRGSTNSRSMTIDSSGRLLVGVSASYANASIDDLQIGDNTSSTQRGLTIGSTDECAIAFADASDARAGSITYNHGQESMIFKTNGQNERFRVNANGICLGGTGAANGLDDYEEGTSTSSLTQITATTNEVAMKYVKIGNQVTIVGVITIDGYSSGTVSNSSFNLPFNPSSYATSVPGADIQKNTSNTSGKYLGFYGANPQMYLNNEGGAYRPGNSYSNGQIGFTATYTTF